MASFRKNFLEKEKSKKSAIISTAFQDHIIKQFDLGLNKKPLQKNPIPKLNVQSKINTGLRVKTQQQLRKSNDESAEKEFVINEDHRPTTKTLAEKIGIVPSLKDDKLDETEWSDIKQKYIDREDFKEPCVICKEPLGSSQQVLLSCSHSFHRKCLEAFEKFSGRKTCPMCRKERYHKRVIFDASKHYKHSCAARIQAAWRGYLVRKWYKEYRKKVPPNDPKLRKAYFEEKFTDITNRLVQTFNYDSDNLCSVIDKNIEESRQMLKNFEDKLKVIDEDNWLYLMKKAILRNNDECSICINKLDLPSDLAEKIENNTKNRDKLALNELFQKAASEKFLNECKPISLLSCSHVFHHMCLKTFEELNFDRLHCCPECRNAYQKYDLDPNFKETFLTQPRMSYDFN